MVLRAALSQVVLLSVAHHSAHQASLSAPDPLLFELVNHHIHHKICHLDRECFLQLLQIAYDLLHILFLQLFVFNRQAKLAGFEVGEGQDDHIDVVLILLPQFLLHVHQAISEGLESLKSEAISDLLENEFERVVFEFVEPFLAC